MIIHSTYLEYEPIICDFKEQADFFIDHTNKTIIPIMTEVNIKNQFKDYIDKGINKELIEEYPEYYRFNKTGILLDKEYIN